MGYDSLRRLRRQKDEDIPFSICVHLRHLRMSGYLSGTLTADTPNPDIKELWSIEAERRWDETEGADGSAISA